MRTERLQRKYGVPLRWSACPLHPDTPMGGREFAALFAGREAMIRDMQPRLRQVAATVAADWQRAMELGITVVPTHRCEGSA